MIRLRVPGSLTYRHLAVRVVAAACNMAGSPSSTSSPSSPSSRPASRAAGAEPSLHDLVAASIQPPEDEFEAQTVSAFGEAFNNIAIHSYRAGPPGDIDIEIEADEDGIVIRLMDTGKSFDPASIAPPDMDDMEDLPESGMGLFIMRSFMDEVEYSPGSPNVLRLVKRRDGSSLSGDGGDGEQDVEDSTGDDFADPPPEDDRVSGHSRIRMRSVARTSPQRAAGGIKIQ